MCFLLFLSTDSEQDLSSPPSELFRFERASGEDIPLARAALRNRHIWRLISRHGGCSCHYRHLLYESVALGFAEPAEWFSEDEDDIESTKAVYDLLATLVKEGHKVDIVDSWVDDPLDEVEDLVVSVSEVTRDQFRFWEGWRFELTK